MQPSGSWLLFAVPGISMDAATTSLGQLAWSLVRFARLGARHLGSGSRSASNYCSVRQRRFLAWILTSIGASNLQTATRPS